VLFKGQPLPGGQVTFVSKGPDGSTGTAPIDEDGTYKIGFPPGEVKIAVDNRMLEKQVPSKGPLLKRPGGEAPSGPKGKYVKIPDKYYSADSSGLTYTVTTGQQAHDITLD
jgi:hypothetical protein